MVANTDLPTIVSNSAHTHSMYSVGSWNDGSTAGQGTIFLDAAPSYRGHSTALETAQNWLGLMERRQSVETNTPNNKETKIMAKVSRRLVKVIVIDPHEDIPLDQCVLYSGEEKLTDLDDQELFFELDIKALLAAHNEKRVQITNKKVKERVEMLEPARIRDLKMVVVTIAEF